jgi:hypothetical protein
MAAPDSDAASAPMPAALLRCPHCLRDGPLAPIGSGWQCGACGTRFPTLDGVPWLFAEPEARLGEWRQRFKLLERELEAARQPLLALLAAPGTLEAARPRLQRLERGYAAQLAELRVLLEPLRLDASIARLETLLALRTRTPLAQDLNSYYVNVHRDWVWGDAENAAALQLVRELADGEPLGRLLVPGAGAGRLAWDVHEALGPESTLGLDLNPLLSLVAHRVAAGGEVALHEFPVAPRSDADVALARTLRAPHAARPGLAFVLGDALRAPLRPGSFDTLLSPWFVDIVPHDFDAVCRQFAASLRTGGRWLNFGSLSFAHRDPAACHGPAEVCAILEAHGFEVLRVIERELPYLRCPASRHGRVETVYAFSARKRREMASPPELVNLPSWLGDPSEPVPLLPYFATQALANRIYAFVMALIDGRRGIAEIARYLVEQKLLMPGEAEGAVRSFLVALYEESRRRDRF